MWKSLKNLIGGKNTYSSFDTVNFHGSIVSDQTQIANKLNQYFIDSVEQIINDINLKKVNLNHDSNYNVCINWDKFENITLSELDKIINGLDESKGPKLEINARTLKHVWETEKDIISFMINKSLDLGLVPDN